MSPRAYPRWVGAIWRDAAQQRGALFPAWSGAGPTRLQAVLPLRSLRRRRRLPSVAVRDAAPISLRSPVHAAGGPGAAAARRSPPATRWKPRASPQHRAPPSLSATGLRQPESGGSSIRSRYGPSLRAVGLTELAGPMRRTRTSTSRTNAMALARPCRTSPKTKRSTNSPNSTIIEGVKRRAQALRGLAVARVAGFDCMSVPLAPEPVRSADPLMAGTDVQDVQDAFRRRLREQRRGERGAPIGAHGKALAINRLPEPFLEHVDDREDDDPHHRPRASLSRKPHQ